MAEKLEDLNLPNAVVARIIKDSLPEGVSVAKEARVALGKAAAVFILYMTTAAQTSATKGSRKTVTAADVFKALEDTEFTPFIDSLKESLEQYKRIQKEKKESNAKRRQQQKEEKERKQAADKIEIILD